MFAQCGMNYAHVKENLARVTDLVEFSQGIVKLIVVVAGQGRYPSLDFLWQAVCQWSCAISICYKAQAYSPTSET